MSNNRSNPFSNLNKVRNITMGILYILVAILMVMAQRNGIIQFDKMFVYVLAGVFTVYGIFRLYRVLAQKQ